MGKITPQGLIMMYPYEDIEISQQEYSDILKRAIAQKHYVLLKSRMQQLTKEGKSPLLADQEIPIGSVRVSAEELKPYVDIYKADKYYGKQAEQNIIAYKKRISGPPPIVVADPEKYLDYAVNRLFELTKKTVSEENFNYLFAKDRAAHFLKLSRYFVNSDQSKLDPEKGLLIMGSIGTGKTTMLQAFERNPKQSFTSVPCRDIALEYKKNGIGALDKYMDAQRSWFYTGTATGWLFDDIGTEMDLGNFGDVIPVMETILNRWYFNRHKYSFSHIHLTTNLNAKMLEEQYGERLYDRMKEMFNFVVLKGNSLRK